MENRLMNPETASLQMSPIFRPFNPNGDVKVYLRNLPHWRQQGATYFVTFRQADSIPKRVLAEWLDIRQRWYRAHNLEPKQREADPKFFAAGYLRIPRTIRRAFEKQQAKMLHEELDRCHGSCVLRFHEVQTEVADALKHFHGDRLWLGDFVLMANHVHVIIQPFDGFELEDLLGSIKKWTSRKIGQSHNVVTGNLTPPESETEVSKPRFWQYESYDRIIRDTEELAAFRRYIVANPKVAGMNSRESHYYAADWLDPFAQATV